MILPATSTLPSAPIVNTSGEEDWSDTETTSVWQEVGGLDPNPQGDTDDYELGTAFVAEKDLYLYGVRIYNPGLNARAGRSAKIWDRYSNVVWEIALPDTLVTGWGEYRTTKRFAIHEGAYYTVSHDVGGGAQGDYAYRSGQIPQSSGVISYIDGTYSTTPDVAPDNGSSNFYGIEPLYEDTEGIADTVRVWEGLVQDWGYNAQGETFVNVSGRVAAHCTHADYKLNAGGDVALTIGPSNRRPTGYKDFVCDIPIASLNPGANTVDVTGHSPLGDVTVSVTLNWGNGASPGSPITVDWSAETNLINNSWPVDGEWTLEGIGVRAPQYPQWGYDRILCVGDRRWEDFRVETEIKLNEIDEDGFDSGTSGNKVAFGLILGWDGHTDLPSGVGGLQPKTGWEPFGTIAWYEYSSLVSAKYTMTDFAGDAGNSTTPGVPDYSIGDTVKVKLEYTNDGSIPTFNLKMWNAADVEPGAWTLTRVGSVNAELAGSIALLAHHFDVTFGNVTVTEIS